MSTHEIIVDAADSNVLQISSSADEPVKKEDGCCDYIRSQDFSQKIAIVPTVAFELYRVLISSCLILFVPQKCDDHVCEFKENLVFENKKYTAGVVINFITLAGFLALYFVEVKRENHNQRRKSVKLMMGINGYYMRIGHLPAEGLLG
jgi:hypothetical protein